MELAIARVDEKADAAPELCKRFETEHTLLQARMDAVEAGSATGPQGSTTNRLHEGHPNHPGMTTDMNPMTREVC